MHTANLYTPVPTAMPQEVRKTRGPSVSSWERVNIGDQILSSTELESGNAIGAFLQTPAPVLDKISGPMGAQFLSSTGLGSGERLLGQAQFPFDAIFSQDPGSRGLSRGKK